MNDSDEQMLNLEWEGSGRLRARSGDLTPDCPLEQELFSLAQGDLTPAREQQLLTHCADCDLCSTRLKNAVALAEPLTPEQEQLIDSLPSTNEAASVASKLTNAPIPISRGIRGRITPLRWMAAAAALFVVSLLPFTYSRWQQHEASAHIAQQLAQLRPIEFRLAGIAYGHYREARGTADAISVETKTIKPGTPDSWRAAVLENNFDSAIDQIENAMRTSSRKPSLLNDLAAVHAARGDRLRSDHEYETALAMVDEALAQNPNYPPALFNRVLILDRLHRPDAARIAAERDLQTETDPGWQSDARAFADNK
jgi:tetratricopeptide (TPR) repeat protein